MSNLEILLEEKFVKIYYDPENDWLYADWVGDMSADAGKYGSEQILHFLKVKGCSKLLNDNSNKTGLWEDISYWAATDWLPRAEKAGLKAVAWVYSPEKENRLATERAIRQFPTSVMIIAFNEIETGKTWLQSV